MAIGVAWSIGGWSALSNLVSGVFKALPALAIALGVLVLLRAAVPKGVLSGPLLLVSIGTILVVAQFGLLTAEVWRTVGPVAVVVGGVGIAMSKRSPSLPPSMIVVRRHWSIFASMREVRVRDLAPQKFIVRAVFGGTLLDLTGADFPVARRITVDATIISGALELRLPREWSIRAGRLDLARGTRFDGDFSSAVPADPIPVPGDEPRLVVLNVQGWGGRVVLSTATQGVIPPTASPGSVA